MEVRRGSVYSHRNKVTRALLATVLEILNLSQVTRSTPETAHSMRGLSTDLTYVRSSTQCSSVALRLEPVILWPRVRDHNH
ncbi:hypothetical protein TNCV_146651 [Trichonephila clavipes]|nr:hypothetical protein TNCV_146651 [Trichonephila clavipes]